MRMTILAGLSEIVLLAAVNVCGQTVATNKLAAHTYEVPGGFLPEREPDGNTYVLEGKSGLTVIDTGRHPEHRLAIEALARQLHKPVVAIVNTHWHLDHVSGNAGLRAAFPGLKVYASGAIDDALTGFLADSAVESRHYLASGKVNATTAEEMRLDLATIENGTALKPDVVIDGTRDVTLGGLKLRLHLAKDAATAGDVWVFDAATQTVFVGDLVTFPAPFLDTACSQGWSDALAEVEKTPFRNAAPGHGPVLTRVDFEGYRKAFDALMACSKTEAKAESCADAWIDATAAMGGLSSNDKARGREMTVYYVSDVLRANGGNSKYCAKR
jgi:glyoxylase-like metal-dependent hydrolase (beta-lactamase superfamily II)